MTLDAPFSSGKNVLPQPSVNTMNPNFRTGYAQEATVGVERVFGSVTTAARYVTSYGNDLVRKRNINQPVPGPGSLDSRRPINGFGDILVVESTASSTYHALELTAQRRPGRGLSFRAAYTLSNSQDDTSAFLATDGDDNTPQDSRNLAAEWGPSDYDVRQRLVAVGDLRSPVRVARPLAAALAGERRLHRAIGPAVHAARQLRQQQHRQRRRRHVRLRSPERDHHAGHRRRSTSATRVSCSRSRRNIRSAMLVGTA